MTDILFGNNNGPDTGRLPEQKNEIATSRIVLTAMGLPDEIGTQQIPPDRSKV